MVALMRKARAATDVAIALPAVVRARRRAVRTPLGAFVERVGQTPDGEEIDAAKSLSASERQCGLRWGTAVDRVLRWLPGDAACLVRSGALRELLRSRGLPAAEVTIGIRRGAGGFQAHAWVTQHGEPIAEPRALRHQFSALDGVTIR